MNRDDFEDFFYNLRKWFKGQSRLKLIFAVTVLLAVAYVIFSRSYYSKEYHHAVDAEIEIAKYICENSGETVARNKDLLKLDQGDLRDVLVNGQRTQLKHVKYPKVMFFKTGIKNIGAEDRGDIFCVFSDPRSSTLTYYYDYEERSWKDKMRFRFRHVK